MKKRLKKICSAAGTLMILSVIILCSLLVLPEVFGCRMYHVVSGSMEPARPVGSLIYVRAAQPEVIEAEEIIAFYGSGEDTGIITHRVMSNQIVSGTFHTKGDANEREDPLPVPYDRFIGRVSASVPYMGAVLTCMTSRYGKTAAICAVALGMLLNLIGSHEGKRKT